MELTRDKAWELLTCYNKEAFHLRHALTVEAVMGWFAQQLGYGDEKAFWSMVGLLHDLDFDAVAGRTLRQMPAAHARRRD